MGYRLDLTGRQVEEILNNALLKVEQELSERDRVQIQLNLGFATPEEVEKAVNPLATKEEVSDALSLKQDNIEDLESIRDGAAKGATALQEHQDITHLATKEQLEGVANDVSGLNDTLKEVSLNVLNIEVKVKEIDEIKSSKVYLTKAQWKALEESGEIKDGVEYNIYEDDNLRKARNNG